MKTVKEIHHVNGVGVHLVCSKKQGQNFWIKDNSLWNENPYTGKPRERLYEVNGVNLAQIIEYIENGTMYDYLSQIKPVAGERSSVLERTPLQDIWSIRFDGQSVVKILLEKPKFTFNDIVAVIENEGGSVDAIGIVHRGNK